MTGGAGDLRLTSAGLAAMGRTIPCTVGRGGVSRTKSEGDGATPAGTHRIIGLLWRPDRLARPQRWARPILPGDLWCDDPSDPAYNAFVRAPFSASYENLRRPDPLYDLVLVTDWNIPVQAEPRAGSLSGPACGMSAADGGAAPARAMGSAIFLHQWRRPGMPTAGCIAMARGDLIWLARRVRQGARLIVPPDIRPARRTVAASV